MASSSSSGEKRCLYEVLGGLSRDCTADEIRSAYKRLALQRHPDKLVQAGVPEAEATAAFQELVNAYEVLSDPRERAWYDSHRNQILFSSAAGSTAGSSGSGFVPDLFSFFSNSVYYGYSDSGRGFYRVYGDLFEKIYRNELSFAKKLGLGLPKEAPLMGNLESPYVQVTAFYNYWLGFVTILDFFWADQYDVMAGPNRKSRRLMEEENKKLRKKAKREYNETVRGLAEFVKKRDKRVIDMQMKRNEEMERKREEEKQRKKELERQKAERAKNYEEPEWAKVEELEENEIEDVVEEEKKKELYCVVCSKKFKSEKQWKNHEQSKKHKDKVAELRDAFSEEDRECEAAQENGRKADEGEDVDGDEVGYLSADDEINDLHEQFESSVGIQEESTENEKTESIKEDGSDNIDSDSDGKGVVGGVGSDDDEANVLEAMLSGRKGRKKFVNQTKDSAKNVEPMIDGDELEFMEYNDTKGSRKNRGGRRRRNKRQEEESEEIKPDLAERDGQTEEHAGQKNRGGRRRRKGERQAEEESEAIKPDVAEKDGQTEEHDGQYDDSHVEESTSHPFPESDAKSTADDDIQGKGRKHTKQTVSKKQTTKMETVPKSKGRRQKAASEVIGNVCEKCGREFESRNKLHKHLGDTGHASLKSR